jgi:hypothetical protein
MKHKGCYGASRRFFRTIGAIGAGFCSVWFAGAADAQAAAAKRNRIDVHHHMPRRSFSEQQVDSRSVARHHGKFGTELAIISSSSQAR